MKDDEMITRTLAEFCSSTAVAGVPEFLNEKVKACICDTLHAIILAIPSRTAHLLWQYLNASNVTRGHCTMIGYGCNDAERAALYNACLAAVHEIDDVHYDTSCHPGAVIIPAVLSASEFVHASPRHMMSAVVVGYEIAIRLCIAMGERHYHYFHSTATCCTIGAAAASGVILGLDADRIQAALGLAATSASGLWEGITNQAVMVKHLHLGQAAERGVRCARLAQLGWQGAPYALEGEKGFVAALARPNEYAPDESPTKEELEKILIGSLGEKWAIERNIFKSTPFCLGVNEPLEGLRAILQQLNAGKEQIDKIVVETSPSVAWMVGNRAPLDDCQVRFSAPFAMALLLADLKPDTVPLPMEWLTHPDVQQWISKIQLVGREDIGRRKAYVNVYFNDGQHLIADQPLKSLSNQEAIKRFAKVAVESYGESGYEIVDMLSNFEKIDNLGRLSAILSRRVSL